MFKGALNDWPALTDLELISLEYWYSRRDRVKTVTLSRKIWSQSKKEAPKYPTAGSLSFQKKPICIRAMFRGPKHTEIGYSNNNPGFLWWFRPLRQDGPKLGHGERLIKALEFDAEKTGEPLERAMKVHFFAHRYAKKVETPKDKITYHTGMVIEWKHGKYLTLVELAYLFGIRTYSEDRRNCQTFASDFYTLLTIASIESLYPVKLFYKSRMMNVLYDHDS